MLVNFHFCSTYPRLVNKECNLVYYPTVNIQMYTSCYYQVRMRTPTKLSPNAIVLTFAPYSKTQICTFRQC